MGSSKPKPRRKVDLISGVKGGDTMQSEWLTAEEAAKYLKVKTRTLLLWVRQGKVKAFAISGIRRRVWRFRQQDLDAALLEHAVLDCIPPSVLAKGI